MNEVKQDYWQTTVLIKRAISLAGLLERWAGKKNAGHESDLLEGISQLVQTDELQACAKVRLIKISGGHVTYRGMPLSYAEFKRELTGGRGLFDILFDLDDVEEIEFAECPYQEILDQVVEQLSPEDRARVFSTTKINQIE